MEKKKAIKIATATVIAAGAFTAVAPAQSEAATSLTSQIKTAKATIKKPYSTYFTATKLASVSTVEDQIAAAKKAKTKILKTIKDSSASKANKAKYTAEVNAYNKYITRAEGYVKAYNAAATAKKANDKIIAQIEAAVVDQDGAAIKKQYNALDAAVAKTDKAIKDTVYGADIETLLYNKFTKKTKAALLADLKVASYGDKIQYWIAQDDLVTAKARYDYILPLLLKVDTTTTLGKAIVKYAEAVKAEYDAALEAANADKTAPVLTVEGGTTTVNVENGATLVLPKVTVTDDKDLLVVVTSTIKKASGDTVEVIDTKVAGTYTVTYSAVDAAGNKAVDAVVTVVVAEAKVLKVESVSAVKDITINEGEKLSLPAKVGVTYNDTTTGDVAVVWNTTSVDTAKVGTYTVTGTIEGTDKTASVKVIVEAAVVKVESVSAINSKSQSVTLDGATAVEGNSHIAVKFAEDIDSQTANLNTIKLVAADGSQVAGTYTYNALNKTVTFVPNAVLKDDTKYTLTVTKDVKTKAGKEFAEKTVSFTTSSNAVVSRLQANGVTVVNNGDAANNGGDVTLAAGDAVVLTFNKDIDPATVTTTNIKLYDETNKKYITGGNGGTPAVAYNAANKTATFTVGTGESITNAKLRVDVTGLKTLAGGSVADFTKSFVLGASVTPTVQETLGTTVYSKVESSTLNSTYFQGFRLTYTFGREMDAATLTGATVQLREQGSTTGVAAKVTFNAATNTLVLVPEQDLKEKTTYNVWFDTNNIKDANGITITDPATSFTTGDYTRPEVVTTTPANAANGIKEEDEIRINLKEAVNPASVVGSTLNNFTGGGSVVLVDSNNVAKNISGRVSLEDSNKTIVINTVGLGLTRNTTYTVKLNGGSDNTPIRDTASVGGNGLALASDYEFSFTTRAADTVAPKLVSIKSDDKALTDGLYNVKTGTDVVLEFDEAVQFSAGTVVTFTDVNAPTTAVAGTVATGTTFTVADANASQYRVGDRVSVTNADNTSVAGRIVTTVGVAGSGGPGLTTITVDNNGAGALVGTAAADIKKVAATFTSADLTLSNGNKTVNVNLDTANNRLASDRTYKVAISDKVTDTSLANNKFAANNNVVQFTTGVKPVVNLYNAGTNPAPLANAVAVNADIDVNVTDDVALQATTVNTNTAKLVEVATGTAVPAVVTYTAGTNTVKINPDGDLKANTEYKVVIEGIKDTAGNTIDKTEYKIKTQSTSRPTIESVTPANNTGDVATNSKIKIKFAADINLNTLVFNDTTGIMVENATTNVDAISSNNELDYDAATRTLTITPATPLAANTNYRVKVGTGVQGTNGQSFAANTESFFRTVVAATSGNLASVVANYGANAAWGDATDSVLISFNAPLSRDHRQGNLAAVAAEDWTQETINKTGAAGTGNITNTSTNVVVADSSVYKVGDLITIADGAAGPANLDTRVTAIVDGTNITVANAVTGATAAGKAITFRGYGAGATVLTLASVTDIQVNDRITVGGVTTTVTAVNGNNITLADALTGDVLHDAAATHAGYANGATQINVASAANLVVGDSVRLNGQSLTVNGINGTLITVPAVANGNVATASNFTAADTITLADFNVSNGTFGTGTLVLSADRKTITITNGNADMLITKDITTIAPNFNTILDTNGAPFGTIATTVK